MDLNITQTEVPQYKWNDMLKEAYALMNSGAVRNLYKTFKLLRFILGLPDDGTTECRTVKCKAAVKLAYLYAVGIDASDYGEGEEFDPRCEVEPDIEKVRGLLLLARKYGYSECESRLAEPGMVMGIAQRDK